MKHSAKRILIVDDDEDDFQIIREYISKIEGREFIIDWCYIYEEAVKKICEAKHDLYFIDYHLGPRTGIELIHESIENNCDAPFILLTGNGNHTIDLMAMESGAVDYLVKGELNTEKLERCIRYSLQQASSVKELRTKERKFRNIFERSKDMVFIADEKLFFTEVNTASFALLEYDKEELFSKSLYDILVNKNNIAVIKQELSVSGEISDKEIEIFTRNGEKKYCILTLSRETDISGSTHIQGIMHDITSLKKAEKDTLQLEKLNVANQLVRIMAHELRNPLTNIMLSLEQLERQPYDNESAICMEIINRNAKRIGAIVAELLSSSNRDPVSAEKRSLQSVMDEVLDIAGDRINLLHIQLQRSYLPEPAWVMADKEKLKIAFLNIVINAIEAMPDEERKLIVSVEKKKQKYIVSIEDNGCGISEENISRVFESYFTSKHNGMGLGLASALNILQSHNASYDVQSKPGFGTVFKLFFNSA